MGASNQAGIEEGDYPFVIDETAEFDLVNSYNKDLMGIKKDAKAIADYTEYLQFTEDVDAMLVNDLSNNSINY